MGRVLVPDDVQQRVLVPDDVQQRVLVPELQHLQLLPELQRVFNQGYGGYYNPGYSGYGYDNTTFGSGFQSGVVSGALGVPNWYGYGGYYGGNTVQGTVGNYLGRELGRAIR